MLGMLYVPLALTANPVATVGLVLLMLGVCALYYFATAIPEGPTPGFMPRKPRVYRRAAMVGAYQGRG